MVIFETHVNFWLVRKLKHLQNTSSFDETIAVIRVGRSQRLMSRWKYQFSYDH